MDRSVASLYRDWPQYAARIRDGVKDLSADQLALRAGPEHAPIWALAAHIAGTRVYWLCSHDAFHAGEISQLLGRHDLPPIDLWARRPPT